MKAVTQAPWRLPWRPAFLAKGLFASVEHPAVLGGLRTRLREGYGGGRSKSCFALLAPKGIHERPPLREPRGGFGNGEIEIAAVGTTAYRFQ